MVKLEATVVAANELLAVPRTVPAAAVARAFTWPVCAGVSVRFVAFSTAPLVGLNISTGYAAAAPTQDRIDRMNRIFFICFFIMAGGE